MIQQVTCKDNSAYLSVVQHTSQSVSSPREHHARPVLRKSQVLHLLYKQRMWSRNFSCIIKQCCKGWVWNQTRKWVCISWVTSILCNLPSIHIHATQTGRLEWEPSFTTTFILNFMFNGSPVMLPLKTMFKLSLSLMGAGLVCLPVWIWKAIPTLKR